ncbi:AAA family ATPase [Desulfobacter curvatus]|uniref:ATP-binding protein n=1 Tax=Desulfobacter curvatus TaxID=2290 RepID=UPI00037FF938|nr:AAA family ATPase [Desulfobacter curvatus]
MKKLPVGISSFRKIREQGCAYVDKSRFVHALAEMGTYYFLSRPRRFGKSLFIDTLKTAFEADKNLFRGLWLYANWDWEKRYPVIHISFAEGVLKSREELDRKIFELIEGNQKRLGVECRYKDSVSGCFSDLIQRSSEKYGLRAVILIDEYDKPILDNIITPKIAEEMREGLKNFYSVIKGQDANLRFVFLTGVSKFSKVSLFSGLNNLTDITLDAEYSAICGYTELEMVSVFSERLENKSLEDIRKWYNGYAWLGEKVYNPFSILHYLRAGKFRNYWFETGTPTFLINLLKKNQYYIPDIENIEASETLIGAFDIDFITPENLLFQAGYLTIVHDRRVAGKIFYKLQYPNMEVKASLSDYILNRYSHDPGWPL